MKSLCDKLIEEHEIIVQVLDAMETECHRLQTGAPVNREFVAKAIAFVREFADGTHHHKEEVVLFPRLVEAGMPADGGPVGVMLHEHEMGRAFIRTIADSVQPASDGDSQALENLIAAMSGYTELLRAHIQKENMILFPMADQVLQDSLRANVVSEFEKAEQMDSSSQAWREWVASGCTNEKP